MLGTPPPPDIGTMPFSVTSSPRSALSSAPPPQLLGYFLVLFTAHLLLQPSKSDLLAPG